jgi:uncharacterized protein (DUF433 family)
MAAARRPRADADPRFPVPLTLAEERQMSERLKLQSAIDRLGNAIDAARDELGGAAFEQVGNGALIIYLAPRASETKWRRVVAATYRYPDKVRFERVSKSASELQARADEIYADFPDLKKQGIRVTGVGVFFSPPRVVISLADCDRTQRDELAKRYPEVTFEKREVGIDA